MITARLSLAFVLSGLAAAACGGDPAISAVTLSPSTVAAGGVVNVTVTVENIELGETTAGLTARGLHATHGDDAGFHLHTYLDNTDSNPLVQTSSTSFPVTIPGATPAGAHQLIVRLHGEDHTIYTPEVKLSADLTVQ